MSRFFPFRMHPEDMKELGKIISGELKQELQQLHSKEESISEAQTFSVKEAARILNMNPNTLAGYIRKGLIKASRAGKKYIISQNTLNDYINGKQ